MTDLPDCPLCGSEPRDDGNGRTLTIMHYCECIADSPKGKIVMTIPKWKGLVTLLRNGLAVNWLETGIAVPDATMKHEVKGDTHHFTYGNTRGVVYGKDGWKIAQAGLEPEVKDIRWIEAPTLHEAVQKAQENEPTT